MDVFDKLFGKVTWETKLTIGKYKGKTFKEVLDLDPRYLDWMLDSTFDKQIQDFLYKNRTQIYECIQDEDDDRSVEYPDKDY